jgi:hypothetical protein
VRNGFLYLSSEADGRSGQTRPAVFAREGDVITAAKSEALRSLTMDVGARIANLAK